MKVSVFILTWNCLDVLKDSFDHIYYETEDIGGTVVVVDNGSDDGTQKFINKKISWGMIPTYFRFPENQGISKGKNKGIDICSGDYIIMLDGDIDPVKGSIGKLVEYLDEHPECDAIGFYPNMWATERNVLNKKCHEDVCNVLSDPELINRTCMYYGIFRRKMFDEGLRLSEEGEFGKPGYGWEDFDFYNRMVKMGYKQWVAGINHLKGKYYHKINSSIRAMGRQEYIKTSESRNAEYKRLWNGQSTTISIS